MIETGKHRADACLDQTVDGMPSGPEDRVCLALRRAERTAGEEKFTLLDIVALHIGNVPVSTPALSTVNTDAKYH